ncbi:MAG: hypothetical protein ABJB66_13230 [Gemmatimonadaceae bacterium]
MRTKIVVMAVFLASCSALTGSKESLRATASVSSSVLRPGESIVVRVTVLNPGTIPLKIGANACPEQWVVSRTDGTIVGPGSRICSLESRVQVLQPGEQVVFSSVWNGDALPVGSNDANTMLPPGNYIIKPYVIALVSTNAVPIQIVQ